MRALWYLNENSTEMWFSLLSQSRWKNPLTLLVAYVCVSLKWCLLHALEFKESSACWLLKRLSWSPLLNTFNKINLFVWGLDLTIGVHHTVLSVVGHELTWTKIKVFFQMQSRWGGPFSCSTRAEHVVCSVFRSNTKWYMNTNLYPDFMLLPGSLPQHPVFSKLRENTTCFYN